VGGLVVLYGYKGDLLHIDLSKETSKHVPIPEVILRKYIGGRGLGAKLYWDLIPSGAGALEPDNVFMVLSGPLSGTMAPCACKHLIITKSPATGAWLEAYSSGLMSPEMKFAGYDGLVITGKARQPVYVTIEDDTVEFHDARHLWGKGAFEVESYVKANFHPDCGIITIGPAGENLLDCGCVGSEYYRKAGRGGAGAVMGSKNLKSLAVKGGGGIPCADITKVRSLILDHYQEFKKSPVGQARHRYGTPLTLNITHPAGMLPTRNFTVGQFKEAIGKIDKDGVAAVTIRDRACYGCFLSCSRMTRVKEGVFEGLTIEGPEYETLAMLGSNLGVDYLAAIMKANYLCDDLGMDTISAGVVIGFAMECYERGILTKKDTGGLELTFGNYGAALQLLELMAHREGFGAFCAKGVKEMARSLGRGTEDFAMHSKGLEFPGYDPRAGWGSAITYAVSPRGACHRRAWPPAKEVLGDADPFTTEGKAEMIIALMNENSVMHSLVVCDMPGKFIPLSIDDWADYLNAVTGLNYSDEELNQRAEMTETLIRRINIREGLTSHDDTLPRRILEEAHPDGPPKGKVIGKDNFLRMRSEYYLLRGWDDEGVPTEQTLDKFKFDEEPTVTV
jgi:aldehyde:ferredoxin oxidoreductase